MPESNAPETNDRDRRGTTIAVVSIAVLFVGTAIAAVSYSMVSGYMESTIDAPQYAAFYGPHEYVPAPEDDMTATPWVCDDKIIVNGSGQPIVCETDPCGETTDDCSVCGTAAAVFNLAFPNLVNENCSACSTTAGTYPLTYSTGCTWNGTIIPIDSAGPACNDVSDVVLTVTNAGGGNVTVTLQIGTAIAIYTYTGAWDCQSELELSLDSSNEDACSGYPATLTITPA